MARRKPTDISQLELDDEQKVEVWGIHERQYIRRYPIDVREGLARGTMALTRPDGEDVEDETDADVEPDANDAKPDVDFMAFNVPTLRDMAVEAGIEGFERMKKSELVDALTASDYRP